MGNLLDARFLAGGVAGGQILNRIAVGDVILVDVGDILDRFLAHVAGGHQNKIYNTLPCEGNPLCTGDLQWLPVTFR